MELSPFSNILYPFYITGMYIGVSIAIALFGYKQENILKRCLKLFPKLDFFRKLSDSAEKVELIRFLCTFDKHLSSLHILGIISAMI